jgi:hypothetical protein
VFSLCIWKILLVNREYVAMRFVSSLVRLAGHSALPVHALPARRGASSRLAPRQSTFGLDAEHGACARLDLGAAAPRSRTLPVRSGGQLFD